MRIAPRIVVVVPLAVVALVASSGFSLRAAPVIQETAADYQGAAAETFLSKARIVSTRPLGRGVTNPFRVTLELNGVTRAAVFKSIDESKAGVTPFRDGSAEIDFQDSWQTEVAAYRIDRMIGLGMVPATVERTVNGRVGSLQWWVESMMPEAQRIKEGLTPPDRETWNRTMLKARLFDQLIANVDRHMNNLLVTKEFDVRLIDHSRSFRPLRELRNPNDLTRFSRSLLDSIATLETRAVRAQVARYLSSGQIERMLQRRDAILALAKARIAELGEAAVIYP